MTIPPTSKLHPEDLDEIYTFAVDLGKRAGKILLDGVQSRIDGVGTVTGTHADSTHLAFAEKDNAVDIVTQVDEGTYSLDSEFLLGYPKEIIEACYYKFWRGNCCHANNCAIRCGEIHPNNDP